MPLSAKPTATSLIALQSGLPGPGGPIAGLAGQPGSAAALANLNAALTELKALAIAPLLQRAIKAIRDGDPRAGYDWVIKALERDERSGLGWHLLGITLEQAGDLANSLRAYEAALKLLPDHADVACDLGRLALRLGMKPQAEELFRRFLAQYPDDLEASNNLVCALREQGRYDEAIETLRAAIIKTPDVSMLWNTMGTIVCEQGDVANAQLFYEEALRLQPNFPMARHNLNNLMLMRGQYDAALVEIDKALADVKSESDHQMMRLARASTLMCAGQIGEGWDEYESRLHPQLSIRTAFAIDRPRWEPGANLAGRSLLVVAEQGLGDEVLFANTLPDVIDRLGAEGKLRLAVESRLVPIFQRSFPMAKVQAHATFQVGSVIHRAVPFIDDGPEIDLWTPMASLLREFRRSLEDFPKRAKFLTADPKRVDHWRKLLKSAPAGPKIGLLWKSLVNRDARHRLFSPFAQWRPVLTQPGVCLVNLQYGDCSEELAFAKRELGMDIWTPPGIDLKQDLDDVAALSCALDLVVGFSNATSNIAAACGVPSFLISAPGAWPRLGTDHYPWYPKTRVFQPSTYGDWDSVMAQVAQAIGEWTKDH